MLDNVKAFWDFFFYPLYQMEVFGNIYDILLFCLLVMAAFYVMYEVLKCFTPLR